MSARIHPTRRIDHACALEIHRRTRRARRRFDRADRIVLWGCAAAAAALVLLLTLRLLPGA